jgi:hypothetical protein
MNFDCENVALNLFQTDHNLELTQNPFFFATWNAIKWYVGYVLDGISFLGDSVLSLNHSTITPFTKSLFNFVCFPDDAPILFVYLLHFKF